MDAEQKARQIVSLGVKGGKIEDLELLAPDPIEFKFGGRKYEIYPLPIKKLRMVDKIKNFDASQGDEAFAAVISSVSEILNEPDLKFIEDEITSAAVIMLYRAVAQAEGQALKSLGAATDKKKVASEGASDG